ncbi:CRISPR-associated endoribonuclease Cas6 [Caldicellulosiruptor naganoensis]|uniref:CRISPR-associated endoribonuclease n=1 Tax=Caldicellulosiruptor naganoensis TaxID=29324 RepID=A0ABY7BER2_9FIRM|nr:CRISPR-associated endoribonuclease Cas6 [Caldicellulosiruptor naganoensis]WAM31308.1 CRISPR-associated endoribonuclease Cas6 [Caldicellulosiruptor naganoensis]
MRVKVEFESEKEVVLPIHYNYFVQAMIYNVIEDKIYTTFLHDKGYEVDLKNFKLFSFSRLEGPFKIIGEGSDKKIVFDKRLSLVVSSPIEDFITKFSTGLLKKDKIFLKDNQLYVQSANIYKKQQLKERHKIKMLSPMCAYRTIKNDGSDYRHFFTPFEDEFYSLISQNLIKKCKLLIKDFDEKGFRFSLKPISVQEKIHFKPMMFKNTMIKGWMGFYEIETSPQVMEVAYYCGLGSKNSQGFGLFEIVE